MHTLRFVTAALCLSVASVAFAHGDSPSFETTVDGYVMDVGYSVASPDPGQAVHFDFDLFTGTGDNLAFAPFKTVTITATKDGFPAVEKTLPNIAPNVPTFTFAFSQVGVYDLNVSFDLGNKKVQKTFQFPVGIATPESNAAFFDSLTHYGFATILIVVAVVAFVMIIRDRLRK